MFFQTHTHTPCFSELVCYIAERSSKQSPQRHSALLPANSSKSCPWSGEVGGRSGLEKPTKQVASDSWFLFFFFFLCFALWSVRRGPLHCTSDIVFWLLWLSVNLWASSVDKMWALQITSHDSHLAGVQRGCVLVSQRSKPHTSFCQHGNRYHL